MHIVQCEPNKQEPVKDIGNYIITFIDLLQSKVSTFKEISSCLTHYNSINQNRKQLFFFIEFEWFKANR